MNVLFRKNHSERFQENHNWKRLLHVRKIQRYEYEYDFQMTLELRVTVGCTLGHSVHLKANNIRDRERERSRERERDRERERVNEYARITKYIT